MDDRTYEQRRADERQRIFEQEMRKSTELTQELVDGVALLRSDVMRAIGPIYQDINELRNAAREDKVERQSRQTEVDRHTGAIDARLATLEQDRMQRVELLFTLTQRLGALEEWTRRPWWRRLRGT